MSSVILDDPIGFGKTTKPKKVKLPSDWENAEAILSQRPYRVLLYGPPGTGKTFSAQHVGLLKGQRVYNTYLSEDIGAYQVLGSPSVVEHTMIWKDGPAMLAWRQGARYVVNEIHKASGDAFDAMLAICDDQNTAGINLETGEYVCPAEGFHVVATMNGDPEELLPEALLDRFSIRVNIVNPHPASFAEILAEVRKIATQLTAASVEDTRRMNIRQFRGYTELRRLGVNPKIAAEATFHSRAAEIIHAMEVEKATKPVVKSVVK